MKRDRMKRIKLSDIKGTFQTKKFKNGSYSTILSVIAIAMVIVVNLIVSAIPTTYTKFDVSEQKLTEITDQTTKFLANLSEDITIYLIAQEANKDSTIEELLNRYKANSSHIKIEVVDPATNPSFVSNYTSDQLSENSIIIESEKRSKVILYDAIYPSEMNYSTYETSYSFDGEGQITSGIDYVVSDELPVVYTLEGHKETSLSASYISAIEKQNISIQSINLLTEESIPEDCDCLLVLAPQEDLTDDEVNKINTYLEKGGNIFVASGYGKTTLKNLESVVSQYNISIKDGIVVETDANQYVSQYPYYLVPTLSSHTVTSDLVSNNMKVIVPEAKAIVTEETDDENINVTSLLTTSEKAYLKVLEGNETSLVKEDSDETGAFDVAVAVTKTLDEGESNLIYVSSSYFFDDTINKQVAGANQDFIINGFGWMCQHESGIAIHAKSLEIEYLVLTAGQVSFWTLLLMFTIPIATIVLGLVIWLRRRRK